ncbi:hypothetical protein K469DRAFT_798262 [Zopfia rhizophila CBS 207.26]|uniref:Non-specific serine/threonine protein kinase n=1 Tax=Zopfia rhizophila CBS 207.26 TaxID=1314779 RepID=A0A6A6DKZ4_9PEZI|nr:hypothetical protein K469DRAFT_798262 [Zopfia rhizophila CBS 207.26]
MHYEAIPSAVLRFRHDGCRPKFRKNTLVNPLYGGQNLVFRLAFPDDTKWAVRMPIHLPVASAISLIGEENALLRRLEESGFAWAPKLVGEELNCENPVGFPFTVYRWIPGMPLQWNDCIPSKREDRDKVIKQLAHILVSLISCTGKLGHGDLAAQNIIVDHSLNITGSARPRKFCEHNIILKLIKLYSHSDLDYREQVIEAAVSKGAFSLLAKTFPQGELLDLDFEIEIQRFLSGLVGQRSGLTEEDLLRYL